MNRRDFLKYGMIVVILSLAAREAVIVAPANSPGVFTGAGPNPFAFCSLDQTGFCPDGPITQVKSGTASCVIAIAASACSVTVSFSPVFPSKPSVAVWLAQISFPAAQTQGYRVIDFILSDLGYTWTGFPSATTEWAGETGQHYVTLDLTAAGTFRFDAVCTVAAASGKLFLQYSTNQGGTWTNLGSTSQDATVNGSTCPVNALFANSNPASTYDTVPSGAKTTGVWLRVAGSGGDGVSSVTVTRVFVEFRDSISAFGIRAAAGGSDISATQAILRAQVNNPVTASTTITIGYLAYL